MIHSEIMLFEIIKLYVEAANKEPLDLHNLEKAFYTLEEIVGNHLGIPVEYEFYGELEKFENICDGIISIDDDVIYFEDDEDLDNLEDQILIALENEDIRLDGYIPEYIYNICLYKDLGIKPPFEEYQDILNTCITITNNYKLLALQEAIGQKNSHFYLLLKHLVDKYERIYEDLKFDDISKLKVVLAYLSNQYLLDSDDDFINSPWYIVLFSKNQEQQKFLNYGRLLTSVNEEDEDYEVDEEDELETQEVLQETTYLFDEITFFISYYIVIFNKYLQQLEASEAKNNLIFKKYLLILVDPDIEKYYLENETIDTLVIPEIKKEWLTEQSFTSLYLIAIESVDYLNNKDNEINAEVYSDMIIRAIFIRCFLDLCINKENIDEIKNRLINSKFYKNKDYEIANQLIDDVIFPIKGPTLSRNTCE